MDFLPETTPGESGIPSAWTPIRLRCRGCRVGFSAQVRRYVAFPGDARAVLDIVHGRLNRVTCPACGREGDAGTPVLVLRGDPPILAVHGLPDEYLPALRRLVAAGDPDAAPQIVRHDGPAALAGTVETWVNGHMIRVSQSVLRAGSSGTEEPGAMTLRHSPLTLLCMYEELDDRDEDAQRFFAHLVREALDKAYTFAFHHGGVVRLYELAAERVPSECLTTSVLALVAERCEELDQQSMKDPAGLDPIFRHEYICATAHALAGVDNPRAKAWTLLCMQIFLLSRSPAVLLPDMFLLDGPTLARLIAFPSAWNIGQQLMAGPETRRFYAEWFEHVGMGSAASELLRSGGLPTPSFDRFASDAELARWLYESVCEQTEQTEQTSEPDDADPDSGLVLHVEALCHALLQRRRLEAAELVVRHFCEELSARESWHPLGELIVAGCRALNAARLYPAARGILTRYSPRVVRHTQDRRMRTWLANERGNALRYAGRFRDALDMYDRALPHTAEHSADRVTLIRNRAIILRDLGRPQEAIADLRELWEEEREGSDVDGEARVAHATTLALAYSAVNMVDEARGILDEAMAIPLGATQSTNRIALLLARAELRAVAEENPPFPELSEAFALSEGLPALRLKVCMTTLFCAVRGDVPPGLLDEAVRTAAGTYEGTYPVHTIDQVGTLVRLADWYRFSGDADRARSIADDLEPLRSQFPWAMQWTLAGIRQDAPVQDRWPVMRQLLHTLEESVPESSEDIHLTASWLADKDKVQREIADCAALAVAEGVAEAREYLDVFEFVSGRELIRSGRGREADAQLPGAVERAASALRRSAGQGIPAALVAFVETSRGMDLLVVRDGGAQVRRLALTERDIHSAREAFERRIGGGCLTARRAATALEPLGGLLDAVVDCLLATTREGEQLCLLPSGSLLGLPLHAAALPDRSLLLERNPVAYAPNVTVLDTMLAAGPVPRPGQGPSGVIRVPKQGDRAEFVVMLDDAGRRLLDLLGPAAEELAGRAADKEGCLRLLARTEHAVILAHGANSTGAAGRGICVSDGVELPQAPLPVSAVPELRRFLLDASDIAAGAAAPPVFVSMACSSGRTFAGGGGSRVGLERSLFANGTRSMVAPLWDVQQASAIEFLRELYGGWVAEPAASLGSHYRRAVLAVRERYPHPFHWAPFALKGSWL